MNNRELQVKHLLESDGWVVLRNGAPDFIAMRVTNGEIMEMKGVEVKSRKHKLSYEQGIYRKIFDKAGIPFVVMVVQ